MNWMLSAGISLLAGFISAMGMGGGGILVLFLTLFLNLPQAQAGGINLIFFLPIAAVSIAIHMKNHLIDVKFALKCAPFGMAGALLGVYLANTIDPRWVGKAFAVFILVLGLREVFAKKEKKNGRIR